MVDSAAVAEGVVTPRAPAPALIFLSGPTAAGKTAATIELRLTYGRHRRLAIVERDTFAEMAGRQVIPLGPSQAENWNLALRQSLLIIDDFLAAGFDTVFISPLPTDELASLRSRYRAWHPLTVLLLPAWDEIERRRQSRIGATIGDPRANQELDLLGQDEHRKLYADQTRMAEAGLFDVVIDSSRVTSAELALRLANLAESHRGGGNR